MMTIRKRVLWGIMLGCWSFVMAQQGQISFITTQNDTLITRSGTIRAVAPSHSEGFLLINNQRYYSSQIAYALRDSLHFKVMELNKEGKLEIAPRIEDGRYIDLYARKVYFEKDRTSPQWSIPAMKSEYMDSEEIGFQKFNYGNVRKAVNNYAPSMDVIKPIRSLQVLEGIVIGASFALLIQDGVRVFNNPDSQPSVATFAVPLALLVPLFTKEVKRNKYTKAIRLYNER
jgi:hypothetical protein